MSEVRFALIDRSGTISKGIKACENRIYVARELVPQGFEHHFRNESRFWAAHSSASIDDVGLTERESRLAMVQGLSKIPQQQETRNCIEVYEIAERLAEESHLKLDDGLLRMTNAILLSNLGSGDSHHSGEYRKGGRIFVDQQTRVVKYSAPPPREIPGLMNGLLSYVNELLRDGRAFHASVSAHYGMIAIQPFQDGNGRLGRLLADLILNMNGIGADGMISINSRLRDNRGEYYRVLDRTNGDRFHPRTSIDEFTKFSVKLATEAADNLSTKAIEFAKVLDYLKEAYGETIVDRHVAGMIYMADLGPLPTSAYALLNGCTIPTARSDLKILVDSGMVEQLGDGRQSRYRVRLSTQPMIDLESAGDGYANEAEPPARILVPSGSQAESEENRA